VEADVAMSGVDTEVLMVFYVEENISHGKGWIFDSDSAVHVCSHKKMFNSLVVKEEGTIKMVDGSACEVISTRTVNVIKRDGTMRALEVVRYVSDVRYNLISIEMLDEEECRIQVQQDIITVSQGDGGILKGEKYGRIYKLKEENSVRGEVSGIILEGSSS